MVTPPALNDKLFSSAITDLTMEAIEKIKILVPTGISH